MYWIFSAVAIIVLLMSNAQLEHERKQEKRVAKAFEKAGQRKDEQLQALEEKLEEKDKRIAALEEKLEALQKQETAEDKMLRREWDNLLRFDGTGAGQLDLSYDDE